MDEEESFARLLSSSTPAPQPTSLYGSAPAPTAEADPWANPFSDHSLPTFPTSTSSSTLAAPVASFAPPEEVPTTSPYVQRLEADDAAGIGSLPDPPSVIAAREALSISPPIDNEPRETFQSREYEAFDAPSPFANDYYGSSAAPQAEIEGFGGSAVFHPLPESTPFGQPAPYSPPAEVGPEATRRALDSLIDDDLLSERDPSVSLKKAFVKSAAREDGEGAAEKVVGGTGTTAPSTPTAERKAYVFVPPGKAAKGPVAGAAKEVTPAAATEKVEEVKEKEDEKPVEGAKVEEAKSQEEAKEIEPAKPVPQVVVENGDHDKSGPTAEAIESTTTPTATASTEPTAAETDAHPSSIPLPVSEQATPTASRPRTPRETLPDIIAPQPHAATRASEGDADAQPSPAPIPTPMTDRVSVSPLDGPGDSNAQGDFGFQALAIGASSTGSAGVWNGTAAPSAGGVERSPLGWGGEASAASGSKFGRGWGEVEDDAPTGSASLFGATSGKLDPWGPDEESGWADKSPFTPAFTPALTSSSRLDADEAAEETAAADEEAADGVAPLNDTVSSPAGVSATGTPRTPRSSKLLSTPVFQITVSDPTKVGDPVRGHVVYTVRTKTTSPHYRRGELSALRRFSDFLWLFESLTLNNPGVIVPPVPDKHAFGRFQETFIETRRAALERCLAKITSHPVLQLDPDLRLFLESDSFATDSKNRRLATASDRDGNSGGAGSGSGGGTSAAAGLLASWTTPKFVEQDDWFDSRKAYLDNLETSLKSLSKSLESASKSRLDMAVAYSDFASSAQSLAESDLGSAMCAALNRLGIVAGKEKESLEEQAKSDVVHLLNLADEYVRFIASVRLAFASRVKSYMNWQSAEKESVRVKHAREKLRVSGKLGDRVQSSLVEIADAERRARDASTEFDNVSKLVKAEFVRFERERVDEFRRTLERHLEGQITRQKELIEAWEGYHASVLTMVQRAQGKA